MRVIAVYRGNAKRDLCKKLGVEEFIDYKATKDIAAEVKRITTLVLMVLLSQPSQKKHMKLLLLCCVPRVPWLSLACRMMPQSEPGLRRWILCSTS